MQNGKLWIAGDWVEGAAATLESVNPATGQLLWKGNTASIEQVNESVEAARKAFFTWREIKFEQRYHLLDKFTMELDRQKEKLIETLSMETGKPLWEAKTEISAMLGKLEISKQAYLERCMEIRKNNKGIISTLQHRPHGVVTVLGPFNFPGHIPNGHIIPALLAGNTVVFKPSELTPLVSEEIMRCWDNANLPAGVLNMLQGGGKVGNTLISHKDIDGIFFTGSSRTGLKIQESLIEYPHRIIALEMGGNNPLIVDSPGDITAAVYHTIQSAFITAGQRCTCARRLILPKNSLNEQYLAELISATKILKVSPYIEKPEPFLGSVISNNAAEHILATYHQHIKNGADVLVPMRRLNEQLALLTPAIIDVTAMAAEQDEEIFGPLLKVYWVDDFSTAIQKANQTKYGLSAGLLSEDDAKYTQFHQEIRAGIVNWNRPLTGASSTAPFGGIGLSGNHRPSAYYAADYCAYPVAGLVSEELRMPEKLLPGIVL